VSSEAAVKRQLSAHLLASGEQPVNAAYEFWLPGSNERADVAVIAADMSGFEIKTERDNLKRLPRQVLAYQRLFDQCTAVVAERHVSAVESMLPDWWGIVLINPVEGAPSFTNLRSPNANPYVEAGTVVRLLWRNEVREILVSLGDLPEPWATRVIMWSRLLELLDLNGLKQAVRGALLNRGARLLTSRFISHSYAATWRSGRLQSGSDETTQPLATATASLA
jgi:hypothetical protein